jgi:hypothetical protein
MHADPESKPEREPVAYCEVESPLFDRWVDSTT